MPLARDLVQIGMRSDLADWLGDTVSPAITPTGTDQAHALLVESTINIIRIADVLNKALIMPPARLFKGPYAFFKNLTEETIAIYPAVGERINGTINQAIYLHDPLVPADGGDWAILVKYDEDKWVALTVQTVVEP